ncbi:hypothetical protein CHLRE_16g669123v5 [Chlamydomonas reinhardtii]|uniref:Uncharacterized protein n=1 Tax=Chlamydomonas reinhardtii TaxID=3055 RepID=A0A2K3CUC9_CHLRE|nr:uncharacterized protein CHLRE_16g669123v5 [Chlamydomonas reinhardtii]PNW71882.1 hypothetical protein CHLRE_16g669123v5 [Chlamydomonas reinhardtii]
MVCSSAFRGARAHGVPGHAAACDRHRRTNALLASAAGGSSGSSLSGSSSSSGSSSGISGISNGGAAQVDGAGGDGRGGHSGRSIGGSGNDSDGDHDGRKARRGEPKAGWSIKVDVSIGAGLAFGLPLLGAGLAFGLAFGLHLLGQGVRDGLKGFGGESFARPGDSGGSVLQSAAADVGSKATKALFPNEGGAASVVDKAVDTTTAIADKAVDTAAVVAGKIDAAAAAANKGVDTAAGVANKWLLLSLFTWTADRVGPCARALRGLWQPRAPRRP